MERLHWSPVPDRAWARASRWRWRPRVRASRGQALPIACDVKDAQSIANSVQQTVAQFGALNILVNNAQEVPLGTLNELSEAAFEAGWQSGPLATLRLMKLCYPHLKGDGCIVNLARSG